MDKPTFLQQLYNNCSSENLLKYAYDSAERLYFTTCILGEILKDFDPSGKSHILDIGPFLPFAKTLKEENTQRISKYICVELPPKIGLPEPINSLGIDFTFVNIEKEALPFESESYDLVLFLEVLEHLISDPFRVLLEIHRVLKEDGILVLTTPNVAALSKRLKLLLGYGIYDSFSVNGIYGRHNREYSFDEVRNLLEYSGFKPLNYTVTTLGTADKMQSPTYRLYMLISRLLCKLGFRVGNGIFIVAEKCRIEEVKTPPPQLFRYSFGLRSTFGGFNNSINH